jgi:hypothetical protein
MPGDAGKTTKELKIVGLQDRNQTADIKKHKDSNH